MPYTIMRILCPEGRAASATVEIAEAEAQPR